MEPGSEPVSDVAALQREIAALKAQRAADAHAAELKSAEEKWSALSGQHEAEQSRARAELRDFQLQWLDETLKGTGIERKGFELLDSSSSVANRHRYKQTQTTWVTVHETTGSRVSHITAKLKSLNAVPIAVTVKYISYYDVVGSANAAEVQHQSFQYAVITGVLTTNAIYLVSGGVDIFPWLVYPKWDGSCASPPAHPRNPPHPTYNSQFNIQQQELVPIYQFHQELNIRSLTKLKNAKPGLVPKILNILEWRHGVQQLKLDPQNPHCLEKHYLCDRQAIQFEAILNELVPGSYKNGNWERLGGLFGIYYNETLNESREDPPPLESSSTTPRGALVFRGAAAGAAHAAQPARCVAPAPRPMSTDSDDVSPRDAAYVYKYKIDHLTDAIAVVERELRASDPAILLKEVAQLRGALEKRYVDYGNACNRCSQQCAGVGDRTFIREHPEKVRATNYEITAKLDLVGTHGELKEKLATLTAERNQLRAKQQRLNYDESTPSGALVFRDAAAP